MTTTSTRVANAVDQLDDAALIRRSLDDPACFEVLFSRHVGAMFAFACARVGPDDAEDVTSELFIAAFRSRANFQPLVESARPWLFGIAANTLRRHHEREARWMRRVLGERPASGADTQAATDERIDAGRLAPRLAAALAGLSLGERDVLLLHVLGELTHEQVATTLDIRIGTVKSRLSRGRARIREMFPDLADHLDQRERGGDR